VPPSLRVLLGFRSSTSGSSGNVCRVAGGSFACELSSGEVAEFWVVAVGVAPGDVVGDEPRLGLVVGVVGAGEAEVADALELRLDAVEPGGVVGCVGELGVVGGGPGAHLGGV